MNRVYRNQAYFTGAFGIIAIVTIILPAESWIYFPLLFIFFVMVDCAILAALETDFFHRNTLRWKQIRLIVYPLLVADVIYTILPSSVQSSLPEVVFLAVTISFIFNFLYTAVTAVVSARRTSDKPLRRFIMFAGLYLLGFLVNTLLFVFVTELTTPILLVLFAYITYRMAMSLSPVGKVEKEIKR